MDNLWISCTKEPMLNEDKISNVKNTNGLADNTFLGSEIGGGIKKTYCTIKYLTEMNRCPTRPSARKHVIQYELGTTLWNRKKVRLHYLFKERRPPRRFSLTNNLNYNDSKMMRRLRNQNLHKSWKEHFRFQKFSGWWYAVCLWLKELVSKLCIPCFCRQLQRL